jgi:D-alanine transaminase
MAKRERVCADTLSAVIVHLNGNLVRRGDARIDPFDRGFLFGDGVYEGLRAVAWDDGGTRIVGIGRHIERMRKGLAAARIAWDPSRLHELSIELVKANGLADAFVYWQVTRGTPGPGQAVRSRVPTKEMTPTVFGYCTPQPSLRVLDEGVPTKSAVVVEDKRWLMGHLKSISLMGNVMASMDADAAGAEDAIFVRDGLVAEGLATNVIVVDGGGRIATPSLAGVPILAGVTRAILLEESPDVEERVVLREQELRGASEVILTGTTTMVTSVVKLDGRVVGDGRAGPVAKRLLGVLVGAIRARRDDR